MTEFLLGVAIGMAIVLFNFVFLIYHQNKEEKMTEFIYTLTDERVTTKNNTNNVQKGDYIHIESEDMFHSIDGIVSKVKHYIRKHYNNNGLERSTHDIIIEIEPEDYTVV